MFLLCSFPVAFLQEGDTCTCGHTFARHGKVDEEECNKPCVDNIGEKCGGTQANSVYSAICKLHCMSLINRTVNTNPTFSFCIYVQVISKIMSILMFRSTYFRNISQVYQYCSYYAKLA